MSNHCLITITIVLLGSLTSVWSGEFFSTELTGQLTNRIKAQVLSKEVWELYRSSGKSLGCKTNLPPAPEDWLKVQKRPIEHVGTPSKWSIWESGKGMPFYLLAKGTRGTNGWPLFISLHGGGMDSTASGPHSARFNDLEWQAQVRFFQTIYPDGLYFIPRMADDRDGRWWYSYCQAIFDRVIRSAVLYWDVDPNRVYLMGISEGGYAGFRLGAHMADRWAGSCAMAAAEPLDTSPPENFRNLPFRCGIGERDTMFNRVELARSYFKRLDELKAAEVDPNAYVNSFDEQSGRGHGIEYKSGPLWIDKHTRNPWPNRVVWTVQPLHGVVRQQMYWLALDGVPEVIPLHLNAHVQDNVVTISAYQDGADGKRVAASRTQLRVYLNDTLANLNKPVKVVVNGRTMFDGKVRRTVEILAKSLDERGDPFFMFPVEIPINL